MQTANMLILSALTLLFVVESLSDSARYTRQTPTEGEDPECRPTQSGQNSSTHPPECCKIPDIISLNNPACVSKLPQQGPELTEGTLSTRSLSSRPHEAFGCYFECYFNESGFFNAESKLSKDKLKPIMKGAVTAEPIWSSGFTAVVANCFNSSVYAGAETQVCKSGSLEFIKCVTRQFFLNCPNSSWTSSLEVTLSEKLYGQPLVTDEVLSTLKSHFKNQFRKKPLVISFHGWTGSGKSYVAAFIVKHMFREGLNSKFVRWYNGKTHFPLERLVEEYQKKLQEEIKETISRCHHSVFVFDEVDKYPKGVLDAVKSYLDYIDAVEGYDFRRAVFIFLTNNGQKFITNKTLELISNNIHRDQFLLRDFEKVLRVQAFNDEGGFYRSELIKSHLIDDYIPFLPMERKHVRECIEYEIKLRGFEVEDWLNESNYVLEDLSFGPDGYNLFSESGCKGVSEKVAKMIEKYRNKKYKKKTEL